MGVEPSALYNDSWATKNESSDSLVIGRRELISLGRLSGELHLLGSSGNPMLAHV